MVNQNTNTGIKDCKSKVYWEKDSGYWFPFIVSLLFGLF